jgi:hypothetical protein
MRRNLIRIEGPLMLVTYIPGILATWLVRRPAVRHLLAADALLALLFFGYY